MTRAGFEQFKTATLLQFRANHRAQRCPPETLESDTAALEVLLEAVRARRFAFLNE